jgi:hypothetical protein
MKATLAHHATLVAVAACMLSAGVVRVACAFLDGVLTGPPRVQGRLARRKPALMMLQT